MKIALAHNDAKKRAQQVAELTSNFLTAHRASVEKVAWSDVNFFQRHGPFDCCLILGGDGTILRFVQRFGTQIPPLLGINLGNVGFMTDISVGELEPCLADLLKGAFRVEERLMLDLTLGERVLASALNEILIHRGSHLGLTNLSVLVDDRLVNTFSGDGLIAATPNGSTAYSLSAGGPIVAPELAAILLTPVCSHTIAQRPLVLDPRARIRIEVKGDQVADVVVDGGVKFTLTRDEPALIQRCETPFRRIDLDRLNYFATLKAKLRWSGSLKNRA